jgi:uncharacterized protein (UPF0548 family)
MTYQQAAKAAIEVQDACNLSGVAFSFAEAMQAICDEQCRLGEGTDWKNRNPVAQLFLWKMVDLAGLDVRDDSRQFSAVHSAVRKISGGA